MHHCLTDFQTKAWLILMQFRNRLLISIPGLAASSPAIPAGARPRSLRSPARTARRRSCRPKRRPRARSRTATSPADNDSGQEQPRLPKVGTLIHFSGIVDYLQIFSIVVFPHLVWLWLSKRKKPLGICWFLTEVPRLSSIGFHCCSTNKYC